MYVCNNTTIVSHPFIQGGVDTGKNKTNVIFLNFKTNKQHPPTDCSRPRVKSTIKHSAKKKLPKQPIRASGRSGPRK